MKKYKVFIDEKWGNALNVTAKNKTEAKKKAWDRFKKFLKKNNYDVHAEEREYY